MNINYKIIVPIEQIKVGFDNFSYLIYCSKSKKAAIVDPSYDPSKAIEFITSHKYELKYIINTHYHSDHSHGNKKLKNIFPETKIVASEIDGKKLDVKTDIVITDRDQLKIGYTILNFILTPGHTPGGICIIVDNKILLTGDTLFIGDCGRTDLPGGNLEQMFKTLNEKIKTLPDYLIIYPGHDYGDKPYDTLENQKKTNKTLLAKNIEEFSKIP